MRLQDKELLKEEMECLNTYKYLIVHNDTMKEYLIENGLKIPAVSIDLFDYLVNEDTEKKSNNKIFDPQKPRIVYPGNLEKRKANFIYTLDEEKMKFELYLYGEGLEKQTNNKIQFKGSYSPDIIPNKLEGDLGLVWSGELDESDEDLNEKAYNKFNTPHKLSCYLAAGLPVIIWNKAASCKIIDKYNVGYKINNLYDINNIDFSDYEDKKRNAQELSNKIKGGYFTKKAFDKILNNYNE